MGEELPQLAFTGMGMEKILPHKNGDGKLSLDGKFPIDILRYSPTRLVGAVEKQLQDRVQNRYQTGPNSVFFK